jgi:hypothetical protein
MIVNGTLLMGVVRDEDSQLKDLSRSPRLRRIPACSHSLLSQGEYECREFMHTRGSIIAAALPPNFCTTSQICAASRRLHKFPYIHYAFSESSQSCSSTAITLRQSSIPLAQYPIFHCNAYSRVIVSPSRRSLQLTVLWTYKFTSSKSFHVLS